MKLTSAERLPRTVRHKTQCLSIPISSWDSSEFVVRARVIREELRRRGGFLTCVSGGIPSVEQILIPLRAASSRAALRSEPYRREYVWERFGNG
jgi:hypothetical protein